MISFLEKNYCEVFLGNLSSTSFKNSCKIMQFLVKFQAVGLIQLCKKETPLRLFYKDLSTDSTTTSLGRAISRKPNSFERLQLLFVPLLLFLLSQLHLPPQS